MTEAVVGGVRGCEEQGAGVQRLQQPERQAQPPPQPPAGPPLTRSLTDGLACGTLRGPEPGFKPRLVAIPCSGLRDLTPVPAWGMSEKEE